MSDSPVEADRSVEDILQRHTRRETRDRVTHRERYRLRIADRAGDRAADRAADRAERIAEREWRSDRRLTSHAVFIPPAASRDAIARLRMRLGRLARPKTECGCGWVDQIRQHSRSLVRRPEDPLPGTRWPKATSRALPGTAPRHLSKVPHRPARAQRRGVAVGVVPVRPRHRWRKVLAPPAGA